MIDQVLLVLAAALFTPIAGELFCTEHSFAALGGTLPSPSSTYEYTTCVQGVVQTSPCPDGQYFNASRHSCEMGHEVQQWRPKVERAFEELCDDANLVQIFPNPTNCSQYVICFGLVPIEQTCGNGLLFNPELMTCDIPTNVVCGYSCPAVDDPFNPVWLPDSRLQDCSRHYLCFQGEPIQFYCSNNLYFDMVTHTCTYPTFSSCRVPGVFCSTNGNISNPRSCTSYYSCSEGYPHYRTCGMDEYFSTELRMCVEGVCVPGTTTSMPANTTFTTESASTSTTAFPNTTFSTELTSTVDTNTTTTDIASTTLFTTPPFTPTDPTPELSTTEDPFPESTTTSTVETTLENTSSTPLSTTTSIELSTSPIPESTTVTTDFTTTDFVTTTTEPAFTTTAESTTTDSPDTTTSTSTEILPTTTDSPDTSTTTTLDITTSTLEPVTTTTEPTTTTTESTTTTVESTTTPESTTSTTEEPTTTTVEATTTTTAEPTTTINPSDVCPETGIEILPYPGNCYMYIICLNGLGATSECEASEIFNPVSATCVPGNRETCTLGK